MTGMTTYEYVRAQRISPEPPQRDSSNEEESPVSRLSPSPSEPDQADCQCGIKRDPGRARSNKIGPSVSQEVGSVSQRVKSMFSLGSGLITVTFLIFLGIEIYWTRWTR